MKKLITICIILVFLVVWFSGCSETNNDENKDTNDNGKEVINNIGNKLIGTWELRGGYTWVFTDYGKILAWDSNGYNEYNYTYNGTNIYYTEYSQFENVTAHRIVKIEFFDDNTLKMKLVDADGLDFRLDNCYFFRKT